MLLSYQYCLSAIFACQYILYKSTIIIKHSQAALFLNWLKPVGILFISPHKNIKKAINGNVLVKMFYLLIGGNRELNKVNLAALIFLSEKLHPHSFL